MKFDGLSHLFYLGLPFFGRGVFWGEGWGGEGWGRKVKKEVEVFGDLLDR